MSNNYLHSDVAHSYEQVPKHVVSLLGYPLIIQSLQIASDQPRHLLDYGCGTGSFAQSLCEKFAHLTITAVDESVEMIRIAQRTHPHPRIRYHVIEQDTLHFLTDSSLDGIMALFVLINVPSQERIRYLLQEIYRVLKPNASFVILDTHPDSLGKRFIEHQRGEPDTSYQPGEAQRVQLFTGSTPPLMVYNYYWPKDMYLTMLANANFSQIELAEPILKNLQEQDLVALETLTGPCQDLTEWDIPPYLILQALKPEL